MSSSSSLRPAEDLLGERAQDEAQRVGRVGDEALPDAARGGAHRGLHVGARDVERREELVLRLRRDGRERRALARRLLLVDDLHELALHHLPEQRPEELRRRLADAVVGVGEAALEGRQQQARGASRYVAMIALAPR